MRKFVKRQKLCIFTQLSIYVYEDIGCIMILNKETFEKFGYDEMSVKKFSKNVLIIKCDMCGDIFEKESIKVFAARQNSKSTKDVCFKIECIKTKRDNTMLDRYGVKNAGQSVELRQKIKKTCNEKYGGEGMASEKTRKKAIDTNIKKYGVANVFESQWCKDKMKISNIKKYGCEFSAQSDIVKDKRNHTFKNKYGVEFYTKTNEYKIKAKLTNNKKYGVDWYLQSNDKKNKTKKFYMDNYGVEHVSQTDGRKADMKRRNLIKMYNKIISGDRLKCLYKPLFSLDEYTGVKSDYKFKCMKCENEFLDDLDDGNFPECKICFPPIPPHKSRMEMEVLNCLSSILNIKNIKTGETSVLNNKHMELDFYLPDYNVAIECNGNYYHSQLSGNKNKQYHLNKTNDCELKGIHLIHILEDEWETKKEIVIERLRSILRITDDRIYGNKCIVKIIDEVTSKNFLDNVHLQGNTVSRIKLGLYHKDTLISVMTFGKYRISLGHSKNIKSDQYELIRYGSIANVVGGSSKLLKYFIKTYNPSKIMSYADRRWVFKQKNMYSDNNFELVSITTPNYWYIDKKKYLKRYHRFNFRKSELIKKLKFFDNTLSEWENMQLNGYDRIWDCGNLKYELNF